MGIKSMEKSWSIFLRTTHASFLVFYKGNFNSKNLAEYWLTLNQHKLEPGYTYSIHEEHHMPSEGIGSHVEKPVI